MTVTNLIAPNPTFILPATKTSLPLRALNWLAEIDRRYRETAKFTEPTTQTVDGHGHQPMNR